MKTLLTFLGCLIPLLLSAQGPIRRNPITTNEFMNSPSDQMIPYWNNAAGKWSNAALGAVTATNAQPPSTVLSNLASYGINYALSNIITVNATPNILTNGILLTNAVKEAGTLASGTRNMLVLLTPGKYLTPTNTLPSVMMAVDNVSTYWMPGSIWSSGTSNAAADEAYMWDDQAGKRTNCNVYGWGQFYQSNINANVLLLQSRSKMTFEYQNGDAENSIFTFVNGNNDLTMTCRGEMHSEGYDTLYFAPSQTNRLNLRAGKIRSAHGDIFEFTDDALEWGQVVVEADVLERSGTGSGNPSFMQPSGRTIVRAKAIINRDPAASIYMNGSALTNALIEGAIIQHPDNATVSIVQDTSIGSVAHTGLWLKNCVLYGPTNVDAFTLTNRAFLPTRLDNCTVFNGWAATNWVRGKTPSAVVVSGLVIEGPNAVGANITFTRTNTFANLRNYGTFVNDGVLSSTGLVTAAGGLAVTGDADVTGNLTAVNVGASGFISADNYIEALLGYQFPYLPATSLLMLEANKTATNTTLSSDFSLSGTTLSLATNAITSRTEDQTPATNDFLLTVDTSTAGFKKVAIGNLPFSGGGGSTNNIAQGIGTADITNAVKRYVVRYGNDTNIVIDWTKTNYVIAWPSNTFTVSWANAPAGGSPAQSITLEIVNTNSTAGYFPTNGLNNSPVIMLSAPSTNLYTFNFDGTNFWTESGQILTTGLGDTNVLNINPVIHSPYLKGTVTSDTITVTNTLTILGAGSGQLTLSASNGIGAEIFTVAHNLPAIVTNEFNFTNAAAGQVLTVISSNNNKIVWGVSNAPSGVIGSTNPVVVYRANALLDWSNTTAETTNLVYTIPGGQLSTNRSLRFTIAGFCTNATVSRTLRLRVYLGSTTLFDQTSAATGTPATNAWRFDGSLTANDSASVQSLDGFFMLSGATTVNPGYGLINTDEQASISPLIGVGAEDTSTSKDLIVTLTFNNTGDAFARRVKSQIVLE